MDARKALAALATVTLTATLAGCGAGERTPNLSKVPLVPGGTVVAKVRKCNKGASAFCAIELVVQNRSFRGSTGLVLAERNLLRSQGWTGVAPDTGVELADESPGHKLRLTYATALEDLKGIDLGWINRASPVETALDRAVFNKVPTMSLLVEVGSR
jgi:hypothetical protein